MKLMISSENVGKVTEDESFLMPFGQRVQQVIQTSKSFARIECIRELILSEVNWKRIASLHVRHVLINKLR